MELKSFRELLLKKAAENPTLQTIINVMKDDLMADHLIESLEKMARPHASMGRGANAGVVAFANQMKNKDVEMMRDALSHHISHYKSALKNGNREVADQHLKEIIPLMHLAGKASAHSGGQLGLDYIPMEPWETNYTTTERHLDTTRKLKEGTKGLGRRPKGSHPAGGHLSRTSEHRNVPDYRYLEMEPHPEHPDQKTSPHKGGYPFEEIQIGNPAKIDAKEAYLHINDVGPQDKFVPHPFDHHPVNKIRDLKQDDMAQHMDQFAEDMQNWHNSEHNTNWMSSLKEAHQKDPEAFKARGKVKPEHHFKELKLIQRPGSTASSELVAAQEKPEVKQPVAPVQASASKDVFASRPDLASMFGPKKDGGK